MQCATTLKATRIGNVFVLSAKENNRRRINRNAVGTELPTRPAKPFFFFFCIPKGISDERLFYIYIYRIQKPISLYSQFSSRLFPSIIQSIAYLLFLPSNSSKTLIRYPPPLSLSIYYNSFYSFMVYFRFPFIKYSLIPVHYSQKM